jgi:hypothetical protein
MLLVFDQTGERFATGAVDYSVTGSDAMTRLNLEVLLAGNRTTAMIDTGAAYVIFSPEFADEAGIDPAAALIEVVLLIRGNRIRGGLHRVNSRIACGHGQQSVFRSYSIRTRFN